MRAGGHDEFRRTLGFQFFDLLEIVHRQLGSERVPCQTLLRVDSDVAASIARVAIEQAAQADQQAQQPAPVQPPPYQLNRP